MSTIRIETPMKVICETEMEDFNALLKEQGYKESDFKVLEIEDPTPANGIYPINGKARVRHVPSGKTLEYEAGNGTAWVFEFRKHLLGGFFKK